jgi:gluconokinase
VVTSSAGPATVVVVMGVSGSGKTTVGTELARRLGVPFAEADTFHPQANIDKMESGRPLTDEDRWPWLRALAAWIGEHADTGGVLTCSALKRGYRDLLAGAADQVFFLHLQGSRELLAQRLGARKGHFMPPSLLDSQLADLEPLGADETGAVVDISGPSDEIVQMSINALRAARDAC